MTCILAIFVEKRMPSRAEATSLIVLTLVRGDGKRSWVGLTWVGQQQP